MKTQFSLFILLVQTLFLSPIIPGETIRIGWEDEWKGCRLESLKTSPGKGGFLDVVLARTALKTDEEFTDILLTLNDEQNMEGSGHYAILNQPEYNLRHFRAGGGSAAFYRDTELILKPQKSSALFAPFSNWEDFTLEFWLYPANPEEGEHILHWEGLTRQKNQVHTQSILCHFNNRCLVWSFRNFFQFPGHSDTYFEITGTPILPRQWAHHMLRYKGQTGMLEYLINGQPSAIIYTTPNGEESSKVFNPAIGEFSGVITLGSGFTGFLDEFHLERRFAESPNIQNYSLPGFGVSEILDLQFPDSHINSLNSTALIPRDSALYLYYTLENDLLKAETARRKFAGRQSILAQPEIWHPVKEGLPDNSLEKGRFLVLAFLLFPDMKKDCSPSLSSIEVDYSPARPPFPPCALKGKMEGDQLHLRWKPSPSPEVDSYLIYFGEKPGEYIYPGSPLKITGKTDASIQGLVPFKQYFFAVKSCISGSPPRYSSFSGEISVRP